MENNNLEQDIKVLHNYEHFARLIQVVRALREECIADMHEAKTEQLQQLSGRILSYDQLLQMVGADELEKRHKDFL
jgi:hypothetical protein|tara:strand:- start:1547 stop:1774 length:228 start_codon:yes stop_codon:yes gene_type:complete